MPTSAYLKPRRVWVEEDAVYAEASDGTVVVMTAEVAIHISRLFGVAGGDALLKRAKDTKPSIDS